MKRIHAHRRNLQTSKAFKTRLIAVALASLPLAVQAADGFTDPGTLGGSSSSASGVSADGSVVVGISGTTGDAATHAFRWSGNVMTDLGTLGGTNSYTVGVSANGAAVVGRSDTTGDVAIHAFRWIGNIMTDLGTLGGTNSFASGVSADGAVVVGYSRTTGDAAFHAFRWTGNIMTDLGTLGGTDSYANSVSTNGAVVVGESKTTGDAAVHAFRWTGNIMTDLGTLGGTNSYAKGVSSNGAVVMGESHTTGDGAIHAFRWTGNVMTDLGTLGGTNSFANGASADGSVVVGRSGITGDTAAHAFRWTGGTMSDLGTLDGSGSEALGVSGNGSVVVGYSYLNGGPASRAFRWTSSNSMQTVEDWLRVGGVSVPVDITALAYATNADGSVVVGRLANNMAFIARLSSIGSGLVTLADVQNSLAAASVGGNLALTSGNLVINGSHSNPLARLVSTGQSTAWLAGDWGRDDHGARHGDLGLAEVGVGRNFGAAQLNMSLGQTWAKQTLELNGQAKTDGTYLLAEALIPVTGDLWATLSGYGHWGQADLLRGYQNAGLTDASKGSPDVNSWSLRARLDWQNAFRAADTAFAPYVDLTYARSKLEAYTETGGGFPARFDARTDKSTELRLGMNATKPISNGLNVLGLLEAVHRFEKSSARTSGEVFGVSAFNLDGQGNQRNWLRASAGVQGKLAGGMASLTVNATTKGEVPNMWLAANWQMAF